MARQAKRGMLAFTGEQTIRTIDTAAERLREHLAAHAEVTLDCSAVDEVDLTFVQMLLAARKSAAAHGRTLRLSPAAAGPLLACLHAAGVLPEPGGEVRGAGNFWMTQGD